MHKNLMHFVSREKFFGITIVILGILSLIIFDSVYDVFAASDDNNNDKGDKKFQLNLIINLDGIKQENPQLLKLIAFINGDIQTKMIDLKKNVTTSENSKIITPFYFNTSNNVSNLNVGDEYFVCGYIVKKNDSVNSSNNNQLIPYDCDEGGIASTTKDSIGLFSTMNKFSEGLSLYQASSNMTPSALSKNNSNKEVKITLFNPLSAKTIKKLDNVRFTAMVKGEYKTKHMDIKSEIKKSKIKDTLKVPFVFNSSTELGPIQIGDYYFGCITANDYWSKEHSECEKRFIQHLDKSNDLPVAH